jgi:hypothetical protein
LDIFAKAFYRLAAGKAKTHYDQYRYNYNPFHHIIAPFDIGYITISATIARFVKYWPVEWIN